MMQEQNALLNDITEKKGLANASKSDFFAYLVAFTNTDLNSAPTATSPSSLTTVGSVLMPSTTQPAWPPPGVDWTDDGWRAEAEKRPHSLEGPV